MHVLSYVIIIDNTNSYTNLKRNKYLRSVVQVIKLRGTTPVIYKLDKKIVNDRMPDVYIKRRSQTSC